jgi:aromatic ring-cleaving dioxygenase
MGSNHRPVFQPYGQCSWQIEGVDIDRFDVILGVIHHDGVAENNNCHHQMAFNLTKVRLLFQLDMSNGQSLSANLP